MALPKQVIVLGITYQVKRVPVINKDTHLLAQIDHVKQEILLDEDLGEELAHQSLLHEVIHACLQGLGYSELHEDETFVQSLASALHTVLTFS